MTEGGYDSSGNLRAQQGPFGYDGGTFKNVNAVSGVDSVETLSFT